MPIKFLGEHSVFQMNSVIKSFQAKEGESFTVLSKIFFSHRTEKFHQGTILCSTKFWEQKNFWGWEGGVITIFRRKVFVSLCQKISLENNLAFQKIFYIEHFHANERGGGITVLSKFFVSQGRNKKFCKRTLLFSRKILVTKIFMSKRGYHVFPSKIFCVTVPKNFVGIPSMFQKIWDIENFYASEREGVSRFSVENICHTVPKNFVGEQFGVSEKFVYRKFLCLRWGYH